MKPRIKELIERAQQTFEYVLEGAILSFTEAVATVMKERGMTKKDLAGRINCSAPYVTKVLRGNPNLTIASMVKITEAINCDLAIQVLPRRKQEQVSAITIFKPMASGASETVRRSGRGEFVTGTGIQVENVQIVNRGAQNELALAA